MCTNRVRRFIDETPVGWLTATLRPAYMHFTVNYAGTVPDISFRQMLHMSYVYLRIYEN